MAVPTQISLEWVANQFQDDLELSRTIENSADSYIRRYIM